MAPRHSGSKSSQNASSLDTSSTVASFQQSDWDTTPLKLPGFWAYIKEQAPLENIKFKTLVELGYTMSKSQVCVVNTAHAVAL